MSNPLKSAAKQALRQYGVATAGSRTDPDFLILGTKRGGTTSMWIDLLDHPSMLPLFPPRQNLKSPHYFARYYNRGDRWYRSHFATSDEQRSLRRKTGAAITGEASPYYLYHPHAPERVRATLPEVKLIVMLRDPVKRAYSHYWERVHAGVEPLSFDEAVANEDARVAGELERMASDPLAYSEGHDYYTYRDRGIYLPQLERWFARFPREQILIVRSEDFYTDSQTVYDDVTDFLGVSRHRLVTPRHFNNRPPPAPMTRATEDYLTEFFAPYNDALYDYLGRDFEWSRPR